MATIIKFDLGADQMHIEGVSATITWLERERTRVLFRFQWHAPLEFVLAPEPLGRLIGFASVTAENCDQPNFREAERVMRGVLQDWQ